MKGILISIVFVGIAVILLCVRILLKKDGRFSSQHISQSKAMHERGIGCVMSQDREARNRNSLKEKIYE